MFLRVPFRHNPIARSEYSFLKRTTRSFLHPRYLPLQLFLTVGGIAAAWPLFFTITQQHTRLLASLGVIVFVVHFVILARTLVMGTNAMAREHEAGHWDDLVLTGIDGRRIVYGKWWAVFRQVWVWHVVVGVMKVGLALGIAQHIQDAFVRGNCGSALKMLCYNELYYYRYTEVLSPALKKGIVALFVTGIFGLLEAGLAVMLGILGASLTVKFKTLRYVLGFILWGMMVGLVLSILISAENYGNHFSQLQLNYNIDYFSWNYIKDKVGLLNTISIGIFALNDGGTLINANILRPYSPSAFNVFRNIGSAIFGYGIYVTIIWAGLRLAQVMCVRQGASVPVKDRPILVRRIWRFFKHPILQSQQHYSRYQHQQQKRLMRFSTLVVISLVFSTLLFISAMPKWIYMDYTQKRLLYAMAAVIFITQFVVGTRTLVIAGSSVAREFSTGTWELLALTNVDARRLILSKWWVIPSTGKSIAINQFEATNES